MKPCLLVLVLVAILPSFACGASDPDPAPGPDAAAGPDAPAGCIDLAGAWQISGTCGADLCTITQAQCSITAVSCTSGAHSSSGTIDGSSFSYTGVSGGGVPSTCTGTLANGQISGTCTTAGVTCAFTGS